MLARVRKITSYAEQAKSLAMRMQGAVVRRSLHVANMRSKSPTPWCDILSISVGFFLNLFLESDLPTVSMRSFNYVFFNN